LLNKATGIVNIGEIGEIAIAGAGVFRLSKPTRAYKRFVINPFQKIIKVNENLTGDLGRLLPNGQIQCLGRIDQQVKVRGYRIELEKYTFCMLLLEFKLYAKMIY
jgi:non-ribosomal peptide synthetase component F